METVLVFGGGESPLPRIVGELPHADLVVAADGGYDTAVRLGYRVDVLVGDFDSIAATELPDHLIQERHPENKDATDLELALMLVLREDPRRVVVVGAAGGRLDHELAVAGLLCSDRLAEIDEIDWVSDRGSAHVVRRRRAIHGDVGTVVTLTPIHGDATGVTTKGLQWELSDDTLVAGSTRGVSNVLVRPVADIKVETGCLLAVLTSTSG